MRMILNNCLLNENDSYLAHYAIDKLLIFRDSLFLRSRKRGYFTSTFTGFRLSLTMYIMYLVGLLLGVPPAVCL